MNRASIRNTLIVESQEIFRQLLGHYVQHDTRFRLIGEVATGSEGLAAWRRWRPQLLLIELGLPDISGLDLAAQLRAEGCDAGLLAVTMIDQGCVVDQAMAAGFQGYVLKSDSFSELLAAFVSVAQGGTYFSEKARRLHHTYLQNTRKRGQILTEREEQVLRLAASGKTSQAIAIELHLSVRTVQSHRYNLMHKLGLKDTASLVAYAIRQGWSAA